MYYYDTSNLHNFIFLAYKRLFIYRSPVLLYLCSKKDNADELNFFFKIFEENDREGRALVSVDDFFYKILEVNRSYFGESLFELIGRFHYYYIIDNNILIHLIYLYYSMF